MLKKFRKVTILALALAVVLTMSATAFAVDTWSHIWYASDGVTTVEHYATIDATRTLGSIDSMDNEGEVRIEADIYFMVGTARSHSYLYDSGVYYASVCSAAPVGMTRTEAEYFFYAYVGSTGEEFESGNVSLTYHNLNTNS